MWAGCNVCLHSMLCTKVFFLFKISTIVVARVTQQLQKPRLLTNYQTGNDNHHVSIFILSHTLRNVKPFIYCCIDFGWSRFSLIWQHWKSRTILGWLFQKGVISIQSVEPLMRTFNSKPFSNICPLHFPSVRTIHFPLVFFWSRHRHRKPACIIRARGAK